MQPSKCVIMNGENLGQSRTPVPVHNNNRKRRIKSVSENTKKSLVTEIKRSLRFDLQTDETTDVAALPQIRMYF